jgi:hypothetical protein
VDATDVDTFLSQFGRNPFNDPCPDCFDSGCPCTICPYGMVDCGNKCVDPMTDRGYCGVDSECIGGTVCGAGEICVGGTCTLSCQSGLTNCYGTCIDTNINENYCGSCDNACESGDMCISGSCEPCSTYIYNYDAAVPKTGQTTSYTTGDDGDLQKGVAWPNPRFTDNGNGTVTDNLTGLIWLKDAGCFGTRPWYEAITDDCSVLANGQCGLLDGSRAGEWRLPNYKELSSLIDADNNNPALPSGHPFTNVQYGGYWSSSTFDPLSDYAWSVSIPNGIVNWYDKSYGFYVWPVRDPL